MAGCGEFWTWWCLGGQVFLVTARRENWEAGFERQRMAVAAHVQMEPMSGSSVTEKREF